MPARPAVGGAARPARPAPMESLREYARGLAGGLLFSLPILYTMEMWWTGFLAKPLSLLAGLAATLCLLVLYNLYAGLRSDASFIEVATDSIEEMGLGLVLSGLLLWLIGRIDLSMNLPEIVGKTVATGLVTAIGFSVGTAQLGKATRQAEGAVPGYRQHEPWRHLSLAACGAVLFAANVAPTEEIMMLGAELKLAGLLCLMVLSWLIGSLILYYSDFSASVAGRDAGIAAVVRGTTQSYAVALLLSSAMLWFFGRFDGASAGTIAGQTVVLGFAAMLGASAGRLLLQPA